MPRVLVIEDDPEQCEIYSRLLYYNGFDVECAASAEAGVLMAEASLPDVIMLDVILPGMDGLRATSLLKNSPRTARIPIIIFSAHDISPDAVRRARGDDFLRKPLRGDVMVRAIRKLIGWQDARPPEPA
ncbi:MAG TPA: response regulator [Longimicrobiales bacterium]